MNPQLSPRSFGRTAGIGALAYLLLLLLLPVSCFKSSSGSPTPGGGGGTSLPSYALDIKASRLSAPAGTPITFELVTSRPNVSFRSVSWDVGGPAPLSGRKITHTFRSPGLYRVEAQAESTSGEKTEAGIGIRIFDSKGKLTDALGNPISRLPGDVDGNGKLNLSDARKTLAHARKLREISDPAGIEAADIDGDGRITGEDARWISNAVARGTDVPTLLSASEASPGTFLTMATPKLKDSTGRFTVKIGSAAPYEPYRPRLGLANFHVPLDVFGVGKWKSFKKQTVTVTLLRDGKAVESFPLLIVPAKASNLTFDQAIRTLLDRAGTLLKDLKGSTGTYVAQIGLKDPDTANLLSAFIGMVEEEIQNARTNILKWLPKLDQATKEQLQYIIEANGLADALAATVPSGNGPQGLDGDTFLTILCSLDKVKGVLDTIDKWTSILCAAIDLGALIPSPVQPVLAAFGVACKALAIAKTVTDLISDFFPRLLDTLDVVPSPALIKNGQSSILKVYIKISIAAGICGGGAKKFEDKLVDRLLKILLKAPSVKTAFRILKKFPLKKRKEIRKKVLDKVRALFEALAKKVISLIGIDKKLDKLRDTICGLGKALNNRLLVNAKGRLIGPLPSRAGTLTFLADKSAMFNSDANFEGKANFIGRLNECKKKAKGDTVVTVTKGTKNVTFCIGDNGSLLDDIFELRVDGKTVLTSSKPVRRICKTLNMTFGLHKVQMYGRAAPDRIGTYFLSISGAIVKSGPPLSGSNLTAGRLFTWIVEVK